MNLVEALQPRMPARIAIVGGGGKTTVLFQLVSQLPGLAWATTTTHLGTDQLENTDQHFIICEIGEIDVPKLKVKKTTLITGLFTLDDRVKAPEPEVLEELAQVAKEESISLVVEADGSRSHPIKAPAEHEPVIPAWAEMVVVVVGLSALGKPVSGDWIHRPEGFEFLTGSRLGDIITIESLTRLLIHPQGGLKNIPTGAVKVALLNQADSPLVQRIAETAVQPLLKGGYDRVIIGALQKAPENLQVYTE